MICDRERRHLLAACGGNLTVSKIVNGQSVNGASECEFAGYSSGLCFAAK